MCGIAGIVNYDGLPVAPGLLEKMCTAMCHRGPDDEGILTDGDQGDVKGVNYLLQGTFQATDKLKLGLSGGLSRNRDALPSADDFKSNSNITAGGYYALTKSVTLDLELSQTRSKDYNGGNVRMNGVSVGGIIFF